MFRIRIRIQVGVDGHVPGGARQAFVLSKHSRTV
jgi:hypothetical protein